MSVVYYSLLTTSYKLYNTSIFTILTSYLNYVDSVLFEGYDLRTVAKGRLSVPYSFLGGKEERRADLVARRKARRNSRYVGI